MPTSSRQWLRQVKVRPESKNTSCQTPDILPNIAGLGRLFHRGDDMLSDIALLLVGAVLVNNFVLVQFLGLCPFMGVSNKLETAMGMSIATTLC